MRVEIRLEEIPPFLRRSYGSARQTLRVDVRDDEGRELAGAITEIAVDEYGDVRFASGDRIVLDREGGDE